MRSVGQSEINVERKEDEKYGVVVGRSVIKELSSTLGS